MLQIHRRRPPEVLALDVLDTGTRDGEDRHAPAVRPQHLDRDELAAAGKRKATQEKVVGSDHEQPPRPVARSSYTSGSRSTSRRPAVRSRRARWLTAYELDFTFS